MNRRGFLSQVLLAGASFTILPGAGRVWRASRQIEFEVWCPGNSIGIYEQLRNCKPDPNAGPLKLEELLRLNYEIMRLREANKHLVIVVPHGTRNQGL